MDVGTIAINIHEHPLKLAINMTVSNGSCVGLLISSES